ncbi:MAG: hypothetical protein M1816_005851 [Peltula sp. TS41687]|nr:MAG: hypothetical protein M1816_005851 [Peltula sp. TS41687]
MSVEEVSRGKTYVIEHLDPEMEPWSILEYRCIAEETHQAGNGAWCYLSSVPESLQLPDELKGLPSLKVSHHEAESLFADRTEKVCLLDPAADKELSPEDGEEFDVFLFGGILGDDPPRDRTSQLRNKGFRGRRLGPKQMTTDTAVRVTRMVVEEKFPLDQIPYVDDADIELDEHESVEMPFRYVRGRDGKPILPAGLRDLIREDSEKGIADLL